MNETGSTQPTPYAELNALLRELVDSVEAVLSNNRVAACLQGSFALGDLDRDSDVDFLIVSHEELSDDQIQALQTPHARIYRLDCKWAQHLEGSYFPKVGLRQLSQRGKPLWYLDHGAQALIEADHDNTIVTYFPSQSKAGLAHRRQR
jgi:hypothetical protein